MSKVTLFGAAYEVTGSCSFLEHELSRIIIDCGMFQGSERLERLNRIPPDLLKEKPEAVLLTHGHLDHCGRLPLLGAAGYHGPVYATPGTIDIAKLILADAARIQEEDAARINRKHHRVGRERIQPLFKQSDVERIEKQFHAITYNKWLSVAPGIQARFNEAGHILGSTCVEVLLDEEKKVVFSGDLGQWGAPIVQDPMPIHSADVVFVEATYGNRDHRSLADTVAEFESYMIEAVRSKGKVLIPTFAVGRTQQILYHLAEMFRRGTVPPFPIYLDSPMAIAATALYAEHEELMDTEALDLQRSGQLRKDLSTLIRCVSAEESKALNYVEGPCVILAGAGMCNAGRILHHFQRNLGSPNTTVLIVGYQTKGSVGRMMLEGAQTVKIFGETIHVKATVRGLGGFSAHAGQSDLIRWLEPMIKEKTKIVLTHGESHPIDEFARKIQERFGISAIKPKLGESVTL